MAAVKLALGNTDMAEAKSDTVETGTGFRRQVSVARIMEAASEVAAAAVARRRLLYSERSINLFLVCFSPLFPSG